MLSAAAAAALAASLGLFAPTAAHAAPAAVAPPACGDSYVVGSNGLVDDNTGQFSWSYGYVQLWYSGDCGTNWAVVVTNMGVSELSAEVDRSDGADAWSWCYSSPCVSLSLYSPTLLDAAYGAVWSGGVEYSGFWAQPGY
jgi:hypothetical protein